MYTYIFISIIKLKYIIFQDLQGEQKVKNFYTTRVKLLAYNNSFFSSVVNDSKTKKLSKLFNLTHYRIIIILYLVTVY